LPACDAILNWSRAVFKGKAGELVAEQMLTNQLAISLELRVASINSPRSI
jgi:hypothetical protein